MARAIARDALPARYISTPDGTARLDLFENPREKSPLGSLEPCPSSLIVRGPNFGQEAGELLDGADVKVRAPLKERTFLVEGVIEIPGRVPLDSGEQSKILIVADHIQWVYLNRADLANGCPHSRLAVPSSGGPEPLVPEHESTRGRCIDFHRSHAPAPELEHRSRSYGRSCRGRTTYRQARAQSFEHARTGPAGDRSSERGETLRTRPTEAHHTPELDPGWVGGEGNACRDGLSLAGRAASDEDRTRSLGGRAGQFVLPWDRFEEVSEFALSEGPRVKRGV